MSTEPERGRWPEEQSDRAREFMKLYAGKERSIYKYIYVLVHDEVAADDVLQETVMVMLTKFQEFKPGTNFVAWAIRIAYYQALKHLASRNKRLVFNTELIEKLAQRAAAHTQQESHQQVALRRCMQKLSSRDRRLIELRYEDGSSVKKISQQVSRSAKGIYQSLNRIRWQLLECIQRHRSLEEHA